MMNPLNSLISVIMPARNAGPYLLAAVESILQQEKVKLELILVDDHTTDGSVKELPAAVLNNKRLKYVAAEGNGVVAAMATGYQLAQGEYIARMDADDIAMPLRLFQQRTYLQQHPDIGIAGAKVKITGNESVGKGLQLYETWLNSLCDPAAIERDLFIESPIPNPTAFFRRTSYEQLGGYADPEWAEDYDMWLRAQAAGIKMGKPEQVLLHWREHPSRLTHCDSRYHTKLFLKAKAYYLATSQQYLKNRNAIIWGTGPNGVYIHDVLVEHDVNIEAFIEVNSRRIGGVKRGLPVLHFEVLNQYTDALIIGAVGARGARQEMRQALLQMGKREGHDFLFAA